MTPLTDNRIRLRHLRTFVEVARQEGIGRAAGTLHVSQPAVTKAVQELEEMLGAALFLREGRRVQADGGGRGVPAARRAGADRDPARRRVGDGRRLAARRSGSGALPTVSARVMPAAVAGADARAGRAAAADRHGRERVLLERLRSGALDLVVGRLAEPERMTGFFFEHLYSEQVVFVVRPGHPLPAPGADALRRTGAASRCLLPPPGSIIRPLVERFLLVRAISRPADDHRDGLRQLRARVRARRATRSGRSPRGSSPTTWPTASLAALPLDTSETGGPVGLTMRTDASPPSGFDKVVLAIRRTAQVLTGR